ncbi:MAG: hypothetical protein JW878_09395 [Methanomicrobia archaeon]|nr:hypothetical protein [Methanomicrobia archaeon]
MTLMMDSARMQDCSGDVPETCAFHNLLSRAVFGFDRPLKPLTLKVVKNTYSRVGKGPVLSFFSKGFFTLSFYEKEPVLRKKRVKNRDYFLGKGFFLLKAKKSFRR